MTVAALFYLKETGSLIRHKAAEIIGTCRPLRVRLNEGVRMRNVRLITAAFVAALTFASPARAACALPPSATSSPLGAARWILENNDRVGFARVVTQGSENLREPQVLDLIYPIKGSFGAIRMRRDASSDDAYVTNSLDRFDAADGAVLFVALRDTASGAIASECTMMLIGRVGMPPLLAALRELDTGRN